MRRHVRAVHLSQRSRVPLDDAARTKLHELAACMKDRYCEACRRWLNASRIPPHLPPSCPPRAPCRRSETNPQPTAARQTIASTGGSGPRAAALAVATASNTPAHPATPPVTSQYIYRPPAQDVLDRDDDAHLPSVEDVISSPIAAHNLFQTIPAGACPSLVRLMMKCMSQTFTMKSHPKRMHEAILCLHMIPRAVTRRLYKGEPGWRREDRQLDALMGRIQRAMRGNHWAALWREAHDAHHAAFSPARRPSLSSPTRIQIQPTDPQSRRRTAQLVSRLTQQGRYRRALQAVSPSAKADTLTRSVMAQLRSLHPQSGIQVKSRRMDLLPPPMLMEESEVRSALMRMDKSSAAGTDAMSVHLLRLLLIDAALVGPNETGLSILTQFINLALRGLFPLESHQLLASARLVVLPKSNGKVRPVAVGNVLRRLIAKVAMKEATVESTGYLQPLQFATSTPCGIDAMVHRAREVVRVFGQKEDFVHVSIDAQNAFNMVERQRMLEAVQSHAPSISRWTYYIYATANPVLVAKGGHIASQKGRQQGDPCSMLLFSLMIHDLVREIERECDLVFHAWYADDAHLVGSVDQVMKAMKIIRDHGPRCNYILQPQKSEVYWPRMSSARLRPLLRHFPMKQLGEEGFQMLGAPIGTTQYMQKHVGDVVTTCQSQLQALQDLAATGCMDARVPFVLQRACLGHAMLNHITRLTPSFAITRQLKRLDDLTALSYENLNAVRLNADARCQISLPPSMGGQGFYSVNHLSTPAYIASLIDVIRHQHLFQREDYAPEGDPPPEV